MCMHGVRPTVKNITKNYVNKRLLSAKNISEKRLYINTLGFNVTSFCQCDIFRSTSKVKMVGDVTYCI